MSDIITTLFRYLNNFAIHMSSAFVGIIPDLLRFRREIVSKIVKEDDHLISHVITTDIASEEQPRL